MLNKYLFHIDGDDVVMETDDSISVKELIEILMERTDCYEPLGIDCVRIFEGYSEKSLSGWYIDDISQTCDKAIDNPNDLYLAYHMPDIFFYAEGGWGHHMAKLGNSPVIPNAVSLHIRFEEFDNTVVVNGAYSLREMISFIEKSGYLDSRIEGIIIHTINPYVSSKYFLIGDPTLDVGITLERFHSMFREYVTIVEFK